MMKVLVSGSSCSHLLGVHVTSLAYASLSISVEYLTHALRWHNSSDHQANVYVCLYAIVNFHISV